MTLEKAQDLLLELIGKNKGEGIVVTGVVIVDSNENVKLSMDYDNNIEAIKICIDTRLKGGGSVVIRDLAPVTPTLESVAVSK